MEFFLTFTGGSPPCKSPTCSPPLVWPPFKGPLLSPLKYKFKNLTWNCSFVSFRLQSHQPPFEFIPSNSKGPFPLRAHAPFWAHPPAGPPYSQ